MSAKDPGGDASALSIDSELDGDTARLSPAGELDIATAPQLEQEVRSMLSRQLSSLTIDLKGLTFIDSSALRLFIVLSDRARSEGWALKLMPPSGQVRSVFQITGAEESLPFVEDGDS